MRKTAFFALAILFLLVTGCTQPADSIFNGKDLSNWNFVVDNNTVSGEEVYSVTNGIISVKGEPLGYMYTKETYRDFILELEYRWAEEASNSGIFVLIEDAKNPFATAVEIQLAAGKAGDFVLLAGSDLQEYTLPEGVTERPQFPVIEKKQPSSEKPTGEWNKVKITVLDGIINVFINNVHQNTGTSRVKEGHIGLQSEGKEIQFRNLRLTQQ